MAARSMDHGIFSSPLDKVQLRGRIIIECLILCDPAESKFVLLVLSPNLIYIQQSSCNSTAEKNKIGLAA